MVNVAQIWSDCVARTAREDEQFDKYLDLKDRPRLIEMWADIEGDERKPTEVVDMDHWAAWFAANP